MLIFKLLNMKYANFKKRKTKKQNRKIWNESQMSVFDCDMIFLWKELNGDFFFFFILSNFSTQVSLK